MKLNVTHKNMQGHLVGVWGLGISGKSIISYLKKQGFRLGVLEKNISPESRNFCEAYGISLYSDELPFREEFLNNHAIIIASPGIDLHPYQNYAHKFLAEADLFYGAWKQKSMEWLNATVLTQHNSSRTVIREECEEHKQKKIIAITGTLGKTSITHLLSNLLTNAGIPLATGGNIGVGMLDLLQSDADIALLELSSFQLEHCKYFAPDGAVITNIYPNHLDRHGTMEDYLEAKKQILLRQKNKQWALVPIEIAEELRKDNRLHSRNFAFFAHQWDEKYKKFILENDVIYCLDNNQTIYKNFLKTLVTAIPPLSFPQNWLIITAVLDLMGLHAEEIIHQTNHLSLPHYRLEEVTTINGITYYNDSKSTIMQATLAAVDCLRTKKIILLLGGVSKGVDRAPFIQQLQGKVQSVICFGKEAAQLCATCNTAEISACSMQTLEEAVHHAKKSASEDSIVLFSPGGASFDLFKDYQERGKRFKELVLTLRN